MCRVKQVMSLSLSSLNFFLSIFGLTHVAIQKPHQVISFHIHKLYLPFSLFFISLLFDVIDNVFGF